MNEISLRRPTQRAPDVWDSAALSGFFLASSFSCSQAESTPAPAAGNASRWAAQRGHHSGEKNKMDGFSRTHFC